VRRKAPKVYWAQRNGVPPIRAATVSERPIPPAPAGGAGADARGSALRGMANV